MNYSPLKDADIAVMLTVANRDVLGMSLGWMSKLYVRDSCFLGVTNTRPKLRWSGCVT